MFFLSTPLASEAARITFTSNYELADTYGTCCLSKLSIGVNELLENLRWSHFISSGLRDTFPFPHLEFRHPFIKSLQI